jgi:hypothetical protein
LGATLAVLTGALLSITGRIQQLGEKIEAQGRDLRDRIDEQGRETRDRIDAMGSRMDQHIGGHAG